MTTHKCSKTEIIQNLQINQAVFMEKLDTVIEIQWKTNKKIDKLIDDLPKLYAKKDSVDRLRKIIRWVIWIVFWGVMGIWLTLLFKYAYLAK